MATMIENKRNKWLLDQKIVHNRKVKREPWEKSYPHKLHKDKRLDQGRDER